MRFTDQWAPKWRLYWLLDVLKLGKLWSALSLIVASKVVRKRSLYPISVHPPLLCFFPQLLCVNSRLLHCDWLLLWVVDAYTPIRQALLTFLATHITWNEVGGGACYWMRVGRGKKETVENDAAELHFVAAASLRGSQWSWRTARVRVTLMERAAARLLPSAPLHPLPANSRVSWFPRFVSRSWQIAWRRCSRRTKC